MKTDNMIQELAQEWGWSSRQERFAYALVEALSVDEVADYLREQVARLDSMGRGAELRHATWQLVLQAEHHGIPVAQPLRKLAREYFLPGLV